MKPDTAALRHELAGFTGTGTYFRHALARGILYTEGVQHFAERAGAYWLLDIIATQPEIVRPMKEDGFVIVSLHSEGGKGSIVASDGDGHIYYRRELDYTDCPEGVWKLYFANNVILLPSEY